MKIFEGKDERGNLAYFEIPNTFFGRTDFIKAIKKLGGAKIISITKHDDIFCIFEFGSKVFEIMEPFGDSSRFHISEKIARSSQELKTIKEYLSTYGQWPLSLLRK